MGRIFRHVRRVPLYRLYVYSSVRIVKSLGNNWTFREDSIPTFRLGTLDLQSIPTDTVNVSLKLETEFSVTLDIPSPTPIHNYWFEGIRDTEEVNQS